MGGFIRTVLYLVVLYLFPMGDITRVQVLYNGENESFGGG